MQSDIRPDEFAATLAPKSDQLNADDLRAGPRVFTIVRVAKTKGGDGKQPVSVHLEEHKAGPWKPCKSERRILAECWDGNPAKWPDGAKVELWRNPTVKYAGEEAGGIQILAVSHMDRPLNTSRTINRGTREKCTIKVLTVESARIQKQDRPTADLATVLTEAELTEADVDRWLATKNKPAIATLTDEKRAEFAGYLAGHPEALDAIRALIPADTDTAPETVADEGEE